MFFLARLTRVAVSSTVLTLVIMLGRFLVPHEWGLRLALDSFLPWTGVFALLAVISALAAWSLKAIVVAAVAAVLWGVTFIPRVMPLDVPADADEQFSVATQNMGADASAIGSLLETLAELQPDVIVLQELTQASLPAVRSQLKDLGYGYSKTVGTVGVWSVYPLSRSAALDLGLGWNRALKVTVSADIGDVQLYAIHAASVRWSGAPERNTMLAELGTTLAADSSPRIVVAGDFNATVDDQAMSGVLSVVNEPRLSHGGFGFTWPSQFPATRPDHILSSGLLTVSNTVLPEAGSDHRGVTTTFALPATQ